MHFAFTSHTRFSIYQLWRDAQAALDVLTAPPPGIVALVNKPDRDARKRIIEGLERLQRTERLDLIEGGALLNAVSDLLQTRKAGAPLGQDLFIQSIRGAHRALGPVAISELHHKRYSFKVDEPPLEAERALLRAALKRDEDLYNGETQDVQELSRITRLDVEAVRRILCRWIDDGLAYVPHSALDDEGEPFHLLETAQTRLDNWDEYSSERAKAFTATIDVQRPFPKNTMEAARGIAIELGACTVEVHHASKGLLIQGTLPEDWSASQIEEFTAQLKKTLATTLAEERQHELAGTVGKEKRGVLRESDVVTVVVMSANPESESPLAVEKEQNRIAKERNGCKHQERVRIEVLPDADFTGVAKSLRLHRPIIAHITGHGAEDGSIVLRDEDGQPYAMQPEGLARLLILHRKTLRLVVLNACYSSELAKLLVKDIDCVIGMTSDIDDDAAVLFSQSFYGSLFDGASVGEAFETGMSAIAARYPGEARTPLLSSKDGIDPHELQLVT